MRQPYTREYIARLQHEIDGIEKEMGPSAEIDKQRKNLAAMDKMIVDREKAQRIIAKGDKLVATGSLLKSIGRLFGG
jgi:hypothetical protein